MGLTSQPLCSSHEAGAQVAGVTGLPHQWGNGSPAHQGHSTQVTRTCSILQASQPQFPQAQHWHSTHLQVPHLQQLHDVAALPVASAASLLLAWPWTS